MILLTFVATSLLLGSTIQSTIIWPSPNPAYDDMEDIYTVTGGLGDSGFTFEITPCSIAPFELVNSGRQTAGEWIRTAFHDMATYNKIDGSGGLDASLIHEQDRPENTPPSIADTFGVIGVHIGAYRSLSDLLALAVVLAVKTCDGPAIPMRVGRIDASKGGASGVPEPQQSLATHKAMFERMGFSPTEMIALVACGHSFGGVHEVDFPTIVPASEVTDLNTDGVHKFAKSATYNKFDNHIATEWIDSTTTNPLVTSFNSTMHSDARIFASDRNVTMRALARDPNLFRSRCESLLGRMIDTVPKEVKLSGPITPYPVKPVNFRLTLLNQTSIHLDGQIRLFDQRSNIFGPRNITASIAWKNKDSQSCGVGKCSEKALYDPSNPSNSLWGSVAMLGLNATIDTRAGISSFVVDYSSATTQAVHSNNGGTGFPMQDVIIWQDPQSCRNGASVKIVAAIRNNVGAILSPSVHYTYFSNDGSIGALDQQLLLQNITSPSTFYTLYGATITDKVNPATFIVSASVRGAKYSQMVDTAHTSMTFCP